ncbi:MAG: FG-GAP-like repeat-containing protein, partial [Armatimonadota bacterium]|nr:FG-GAP-like repeat-containing protein [Armatimonadota bacterium]
MKPLSSSKRLRLLVGAAVLAAFVIALVSYGIWRHIYTPKDNYRDMVNAFYTGAIALEVGDPGHALPNLIKATQLNPKEPAAWADLGLYYLRQNNFDEAGKNLQKARDLAPQNAKIAALYGLLKSEQQSYSAAIAAYQQAIDLDPKDLRSRYALEQLLEEQAGPDMDVETLKQLQTIYDAAPDNLFAEFSLARAAAKAGNAALTRRLVAQIATHSAAWEPAFKQDMKAVQTAAAGLDVRAVILPLRGLQNEISPEDAPNPTYYADALSIRGPSDVKGTPITHFLALPTPPATPAAPDMALKFTPQSLTAPAPGPWAWAQSNFLMSNGPLVLLVANGHEVRAGNATMAFPGGPKATTPSPEGVVVFDMNNDAGPTASVNDNLPLDIACAGAGGLRLYRQGKGGAFADVTTQSKLPPNVIGAAYTGVWANDLESDGNLDLILGSTGGSPTVLRNNGEGTWTPLHPFGPAKSGLTQWAWADLDGDGLPDAAFLDSRG